MALTDHVAILTYSALAQSRKNKNNDRIEFFALFAFPPTAANDLMAVFAARANGAPISNFQLGIETNANQKKPIPGVPGDWFIVRAATQYAPYVADAQGQQLDQVDPASHVAIRNKFYAGAKVRASLTAWTWVNKFGQHGMSLNLVGVMEAGQPAPKLTIGQNPAGSAFAQYAQAVAPQGGVAAQSGTPQTTAPAASANPFAAQAAQIPAAQESGGAQGGNPFAQAAKPDGSNPFV